MGGTDLGRLLAGLNPRLDPVPYVFATSPGAVPAGITPLATFIEDEGLSVVVTAADWRRTGLPGSGDYARLTMTVQSSLEAVGMTGAIATALTREGISANVIAAARHDHIFVPWDRRHEALAAIEALTRAAIHAAAADRIGRDPPPGRSGST